MAKIKHSAVSDAVLDWAFLNRLQSPGYLDFSDDFIWKPAQYLAVVI